MKIDFSCCKTHSFYSVLPPLLSLLPPLFPGFLFSPPISFIFLFFPRMIKDSFSFFLFLFCLRLFEGVSGITSHQRSGTFCFRLFSDRFFLVACYATLQPAFLVRPLVRPSVGPSVGPSIRPSVRPSVRHTLLFFCFYCHWPHYSCPNV